MLLPSEPRPGQPLQANWGAAVIRYLRSITPRPSVDMQVDRTANGTTFRPRPVPAIARAAGGGDHPFRVSDASTTEPAVARVRVGYGTVDTIVPTIGSVALSADPGPVLIVVTGHIYLDCTVDVDDGTVTSVAVANAVDVPADTGTHAHISIAYVTVADGAVTVINQGVQHSLWHQRCPADEDGDNLFWAV